MNYKNLFRRKSIASILNSLTEEEKNPNEGELSRSLKKSLTTKDLTAFGIAAIIGAGIFSTIGNAAYNGGPAVALLFVFTAIACGFSGLCYAEFASRIPIAGSAYTYAYTSFGELFAWIIGWDLILEYAIGNIAVAISWSNYFTGFLRDLGIKLPEYIIMDYLTAYRGYNEVLSLLSQGKTLEELPNNLINSYNAWINSPNIFGLHLIADIPALLIVVFITYLVYKGIKESKNASNIMVAIKLGIVLMVILVGAFYIKPENWSPFAPNGFSGVMSGVSAVFFAYIGFDAISTTAEECKNPQKDLPKGIIYSLVICTILYIAISFVLTGLVSYKELNVGDPLAYVFGKIELNWVAGVISFSAIIAMTGVLLVFQIGQPRIWMSMSRDGLLPKVFSKIHPKYQTPYIATIITGFLVGIPALFMNLTEVTDLTSIGTLFAFVLVCGGILLLDEKEEKKGDFKVPYINGKFIVPMIFIISIFFINKYVENGFLSILDISNKDNIPYILFFIVFLVVSILSFIKKLSLIPVLGLLSCFYLMSELGYTNWLRFAIWLFIGIIIYFLYGYKNSKIMKENE